MAWHTWLEERGVELEKDHSAQPRRSADDAETPSAPGAAELAEEALGA
ncbi:MAG: hypothetical protein JWM93_1173 [Frankiales bacterium]|nr:hypothetical protein [Frankiales bacterium]